MTLHDDLGNPITEFPEVSGERVMPIGIKNLLVDEKYDAFYLNYAGGNLSMVTFKEDGTTVATLTLSYTAGSLNSVVKT